jgi:hypothetical protein
MYCPFYAWYFTVACSAMGNWSLHALCVAEGAQENQHGPPPLQSGIDYINSGEEDQMVSRADVHN